MNKLIILSALSIISACNPITQNTMKPEINEILTKEAYDKWSGFSENFSPNTFSRLLDTDVGEYTGFSGTPVRKMKVVTGGLTGKNDSQIEAYFLDENPVKLVISFPEVSKKWLEGLGTPDMALPYYFDVVEVLKGETVFLEQGIAVRYTPEMDKVYEVILFDPCTKEQYMSTVHQKSGPPREPELE